VYAVHVEFSRDLTYPKIIKIIRQSYSKKIKSWTFFGTQSSKSRPNNNIDSTKMIGEINKNNFRGAYCSRLRICAGGQKNIAIIKKKTFTILQCI